MHRNRFFSELQPKSFKFSYSIEFLNVNFLKVVKQNYIERYTIKK